MLGEFRRLCEPGASMAPEYSQPAMSHYTMDGVGELAKGSEALHAEIATLDAYRERSYFPELDGLRAVSILMVVSVHMHDKIWAWLNGRLGVTIFFVLSGFLITTLALREERARGDLCFSAFYIRRSFRIFPAYYMTLGLYCLLILGMGMRPESKQALRGALPYYLTYMQEVPFFWGTDGTYNVPFIQSWSLGVEEKFYLAWPLLAFALWKGSRRTRLAGTVTLTVVFATAPALEYLGFGRLGAMIMPHSQILLGCLVALLLDDRAWFGRLSFLGRRTWTWTALIVLTGLHAFISHGNPVGGFAYAIACSSLLAGVVVRDGLIRRVLSWGVLTAIGRLSYGIYLLHFFGLNAAEKIARPGTGRVEVSILALVLTWVISVAMAYAMALAVERPCIGLGRRLSRMAIVSHSRRRVQKSFPYHNGQAPSPRLPTTIRA
jgi:peptidoglycan/LPS O-acetylase OafA/YrhL